MNDPEPDTAELVNTALLKIEKDAKSDIFMYAGPVAVKSEREFNQCLVANKKQDNVLCFVTTYGGSADVAYQLVRSIRRNYPGGKFTLFVDSVCKSAGTLIALGADVIVMSDTAELGPLDIQLQKPGELGELVSGLTATQALSTLRDAAFDAFESQFLQLRYRSGGVISTRLAADLAVKIVVGLFKPIYAQFDPMRLGENTRANKIAHAYGERIATANVKDETLDGLINHYPSHGFVIDRDEAATLFKSVRKPTIYERGLGAALWQVCFESLSGDEPIIRSLRGEEDEGEDDETPDVGEQDQKSESSNGEAAAGSTDSDRKNASSTPKENTGCGEAG